jgi:hypothetical protein
VNDIAHMSQKNITCVCVGRGGGFLFSEQGRFSECVDKMEMCSSIISWITIYLTSVVVGIAVVIKRNLAWKCIGIFRVCVTCIFSFAHFFKLIHLSGTYRHKKSRVAAPSVIIPVCSTYLD